MPALLLGPATLVPSGLAAETASLPNAVAAKEPIRTKLIIDLEKTANLQALLEAGWEIKKGDVDDWAIQENALVMVSRDDSNLIGRPLPVEDPRQYPIVAFDLKVEAVPQGADPKDKDTDDGAFQLYLVFDKGGGWFGLAPGHTLCYLWSSDRPKKGQSLTSAHSKKVKIVSIGSGVAENPEWVSIEIDYTKDYRRLFNSEDIPPLKAVSLQADSDNVASESKASVRNLRLLAYE